MMARHPWLFPFTACLAVLLSLSTIVVVAADDQQCNVNEAGERVCTQPLCTNHHEFCDFWASEGECEANKGYMLKNCAKACGTCKSASPVDEVTRRQLAKAHTKDKDDILHQIKEYGEAQVVEGAEATASLLVVRQTIVYMKNFVLRDNPTHTMSPETIEKCRNRHDKCAFWSAIGECDANAAWMATNCAPSCRSCHKIDFATRCPPRDSNHRPALKGSGELNAMFERIVATAPGNTSRSSTESDAPQILDVDNVVPPYTVTVHSRPWTNGEPNEDSDANSKYGGPPWIVTFDGFLTGEECKRFIELGYESKFKRSEDVGGRNFDGSVAGTQSTRRTSENAWCFENSGCMNDEVVTRVRNRIVHVTGVEANNFEHFQILKYEEGQFYSSHHDFIPHQKDRQCGPRILTFFLYLSDVEEGGGTRFADLDLTVQPKRGRAVLWPSVLDSNPFDIDRRTRHEALPVERGVKFGANAWIHAYDYINPQKIGCN